MYLIDDFEHSDLGHPCISLLFLSREQHVRITLSFTLSLTP